MFSPLVPFLFILRSTKGTREFMEGFFSLFPLINNVMNKRRGYPPKPNVRRSGDREVPPFEPGVWVRSDLLIGCMIVLLWYEGCP
jgi:hypothetical protein